MKLSRFEILVPCRILLLQVAIELNPITKNRQAFAKFFLASLTLVHSFLPSNIMLTPFTHFGHCRFERNTKKQYHEPSDEKSS